MWLTPWKVKWMKRLVAYPQVRRIQVKVKPLSRVWLFPTPCTVTQLFRPWNFPARLEWVAISFSRGSSWPRDWTQVSHIAGRRFTLWATREAPKGWWDVKVAQSCLILRPHRWQPTRLLCTRDSLGKNIGVGCHFLLHHGLYSPWNSPGQNTGLGSLSLLQGIFPTQGSNQGLPHCGWGGKVGWGRILYQLSHQGSPRILEWVAYPFSRGSSWPRNWTWDSCIAGRFFTNWATREAWIK